MAEEMEKAQKALRNMDYDSMSEDGDDEGYDSFPKKMTPPRTIEKGRPADILPPPEISSASATSLERFLTSEDSDDENNTNESTNNGTINNQFDPLARPPPQNSLFDDEASTSSFSVELQTIKTDAHQNDDEIEFSRNPNTVPISNNTLQPAYPGTAGFLEMEEEPLRETNSNNINSQTNAAFGMESIKTDSGLVLTHRKSSNVSAYRNEQPHQTPQDVFRDTQQNYFEVENGVLQERNKGNPNYPRQRTGGKYFAGSSSGGILGGGNGKHSMPMVQAKRLLSYVKIWVVLFLIVVLAMTGVFFHSVSHQEDTTSKTSSSSSLESSSIDTNAQVDKIAIEITLDTPPDEILLLPLPDSSQVHSQHHQQSGHNHPRRLQVDSLNDAHVANNGSDNSGSSHGFLQDLRQEFEDWKRHHRKVYHSEDENNLRFSIWSQNHQRTAEKNTRHGPCTLTKQHVFGSNQFKDLSPQEFQTKFLTGYKGAFTDVLEKKNHQEWSPGARQLRKDSGIGMVLNPNIHTIKIHDSVVEKQRHLSQGDSRYKPQVLGSQSMNCKWYDLSCLLRYVWISTGIQFGSLIGTMEPKFDADAFPNSVDWRDSGAVTGVRTQGDCGACWAVTAVETVESAHFIATGNLYELSESEIIVCDDSCEMCSGGWPQNAYEWVMDHGGLPLRNNFPYDAYTLLALTSGLEGESAYYTEETVESYRAEVCPADDDSNSGSGSGDSSYWENGMNNKNYADYSSQGRYGNIKGYGYATDRCLCYTDGSGCDCNDQDEDTAVGNIATYGPAVVCLEASMWQDYTGGIMTSEIGCGQEFLDMNHCVQVVGYAFTTGADCNGEEDCGGSDDNGSGSNSNSRSGDSNDREGYWIVRNQWGESWGMNGYAYVSMGENTCGILNDMTIAWAGDE